MLGKLDRLIERLKIEEKERIDKEKKLKEEKEKAKRKKLKGEEERKLEEMKKDARKVKAKMMKERWGMMNWVTAYISQNQEWWEMEKREREDERSRRIEE